LLSIPLAVVIDILPIKQRCFGLVTESNSFTFTGIKHRGKKQEKKENSAKYCGTMEIKMINVVKALLANDFIPVRACVYKTCNYSKVLHVLLMITFLKLKENLLEYRLLKKSMVFLL